MIGTTLSHFRITAKLGQGGMGEVYRAEDTKLGRQVAIKVLPEAVATDPERLARFEREAKVLASLNHPHIAAIYSIETAEQAGTEARPSDIHFLVMELAEGEDLTGPIASGPLALEQALTIALQISEALEVAHERGIIHRDLKPANIKVDSSGQVKILDFGLAKAMGSGTGTDQDPSQSPLSLSPTLTARMTGAGVILGTAAYMSPEQARGQEADRRSDIWSFGLILHEMLTGQRLFQADTVSDTLARVLMQEPEWDKLEQRLPAPILRLLQRCLERDARNRLQAIGEARIALQRYLTDPQQAEVASEPVTSTPRRAALATAILWLAAGLVIGGLAMLLFSRLGPDETPPTGLRYSIAPVVGVIAGSEDTNGLDISRDGRKIVFVGTNQDGTGTQLYLKTDDEAEARPIPETEGARSPFFSPDGEWVAYFTDAELAKVSLSGGSPITLTPTRERRGGVWHQNGSLYIANHSAGPISRISAGGGELTPVTELDADRLERTHRWPSMVPGGKAILYTSDTHETTEYYDDARIEAHVLATGERRVVLEGSSRAVAVAGGHLIFARDASLFSIPFDLESLEVSGAPHLVVQGVLTVVVSGAVQFAISDNGTLAYVPGEKTTEVFDLVWLTAAGEAEIASSERGGFFQAALSPQGDRVVLAGSTRDSQDLWILDMDRQTLSRFTFENTNLNPVWAPDGKTIIFSSTLDGTHIKPYRKSADGIGEPELLWDAPGETVASCVSSDGRWLIVELDHSAGQDQATEIWILDLEGEQSPTPFLQDRFRNRFPALSPDDRWIAYISSESGSDHVYVRPYPSAAGKWQISNVVAREPRWSPDGKRLFYRSVEGLKYVDVDTSQGFRVGRPVLVEPGNIGGPFNMTFSISSDSQRLLALRPHVEDQSQWRVHVVVGWLDEILHD